MCQTIKKMHSGMKFEGPDTEENKQWRETAMAISQAIEEQFHAVLDPYVKRLEEIDEAITGKLPKPPGSIILPGEDIN
jgi:hypothetical protein